MQSKLINQDKLKKSSSVEFDSEIEYSILEKPKLVLKLFKKIYKKNFSKVDTKNPTLKDLKHKITSELLKIIENLDCNKTLLIKPTNPTQEFYWESIMREYSKEQIVFPIENSHLFIKNHKNYFNAAFLRDLYQIKVFQLIFRLFVNSIFTESNNYVNDLITLFGFSCCNKCKHIDQCVEKWSLLEFYIKNNFLEDLEVLDTNAYLNQVDSIFKSSID